jgi:alpha-amylase/alpha-mannosidase (GH57 family)
MTSNQFCVHAHFYQPPREDPLTGAIPKESGAAPYSNWNERIHAECYKPNADLGNFAQISFNIGPTLYGWMSAHDEATYRKIIAQDAANISRNGVGNAIAQAYNHTILPLALPHDKITQVTWGIADFRFRYGRDPQGMWLPETAVDMETLSILADHGIRFTILAPWQADVENVDVTEPYTVRLPHGRSINVFLYHAELSAGISFNPSLTVNADQFVGSDLVSRFSAAKTQAGEPQLIVIASDGELYGHHQPHRDLFLAHLVDGAGRRGGLTSTYPALWLKEHTVRRSIGIRENTSWSCHHGVSRWQGTCSCTPGDGTWKARLREALERLAREIDNLYLQTLKGYIRDPWGLRDRYIHVMLGEMSMGELVAESAGLRLPEGKVTQIHLLLEAQRERQRMFTSCGWFFPDFDRIEPKNNLAYAAQAVRLSRKATGIDLQPFAEHHLSKVHLSVAGLRADQVFNSHLERAALG